jgi:alpha-L-fucosidase 2
MVVRFRCDKAAGLNLRLTLTREKDAVTSAATEPNCIAMRGQITSTDTNSRFPGMRFASYIKAATATGKVTVDKDGIITVKGATELVLYITAATTYEGKNPDKTCMTRLHNAMAQPVKKLFNDHLKDYQSLYGRVKSIFLKPALRLRCRRMHGWNACGKQIMKIRTFRNCCFSTAGTC